MNSDAIQDMQTAALIEFGNAATAAELESARTAYLGKKSALSKALAGLKALSPDDRKTAGAALNAAKTAMQAAHDDRKQTLVPEAAAPEQHDPTLPVPLSPLLDGRIHPVSRAAAEAVAVMESLGYRLAAGPEIETYANNFAKLNFQPDHPAASMHDTFWLDGDRLLRTHTSTVQVRELAEHGAPLYIAAPGKTYRRDQDRTHSPMFHQIEALAVDAPARISLAQLKWTVEEFVRRFFADPATEFRWRFSYFPFVEPGLEADIACGGEWLEILGCGMVHPNVLAAAGLDPAQWQGFAFGAGLDRLAMLKYGLPDLRDCFANDVRWLDYYGQEVA